MATETIAAIATPPGKGGIGIIRLSGPNAASIAKQIGGVLPQPRVARYQKFLASNGETIDSGLLLYFPAPHSFTGEDVVELQGHGGPLVLDLLLSRVLALGARLARPGEFSERAFLNDKIDLAQAEAIADLIEAGSHQAARAAQRSLQGEFSKHITQLIERLIRLRTYIEAAIDFPEEEVDFLNQDEVDNKLKDILVTLAEILMRAQQGCVMREGLSLVLTGRPNVGKSSLLNQLCECDAAIVTDIPGTTRDVLKQWINLDGMPVHLIDTAGLRASEDPVEQEGMRRAWEQIKQADLLVMVLDAVPGYTEQDQALRNLYPAEIPVILVMNKIDLAGIKPSCDTHSEPARVSLSAKTGVGVDLLRNHIKNLRGYQGPQEGAFMARRRHLDSLTRAQDFLLAGSEQLLTHRAGELLAEDLRSAQQALGEITGEFTSDDLLGRIFSTFCLGK